MGERGCRERITSTPIPPLPRKLPQRLQAVKDPCFSSSSSYCWTGRRYLKEAGRGSMAGAAEEASAIRGGGGGGGACEVR